MCQHNYLHQIMLDDSPLLVQTQAHCQVPRQTSVDRHEHQHHRTKGSECKCSCYGQHPARQLAGLLSTGPLLYQIETVDFPTGDHTLCNCLSPKQTSIMLHKYYYNTTKKCIVYRRFDLSSEVFSRTNFQFLMSYSHNLFPTRLHFIETSISALSKLAQMT